MQLAQRVQQALRVLQEQLAQRVLKAILEQQGLQGLRALKVIQEQLGLPEFLVELLHNLLFLIQMLYTIWGQLAHDLDICMYHLEQYTLVMQAYH